MVDKHPYVQSPGHLDQVIRHLRKSFPNTVDASTLKKLGFAPNNESYVVNTLRFVGFIDDQGSKTELAGKLFSLHEDSSFQKQFGEAVKSAYSGLFNLHGDEAWKKDNDGLITFFRGSDQSSEIVGKRQANTFVALRSLAGHSEIPSVSNGSPKTRQVSQRATQPRGSRPKGKTETAKDAASGHSESAIRPEPGVALTVRIEVNLPASGDQATYDRIFKSIRENLLNA